MNNLLQNWIPYKITDAAAEPLCYWLNTFNIRFTEPFFDSTISRCKSLNNNRFRSVGTLDLLEQWAINMDHIEPTAFIFHISRCGSTLVSQLLDTDEQNICLAEVPFFDDVLRLPFKNTDWTTNKTGQLFTDALKFYGQKRTGNETRLFVKTDSWHIFFYEQIRERYPEVPFILLYRTPAEVLYSHTKKRGMQSVPGVIEPQLFGFEPEEALNQSLDVYTANVLERYLGRYLEIAQKDKNTLLLNYNQGPIPMVQDIAAFTQTPISDDILLKMKERSGYHSKHPNQLFTEEQTTNIPGFLTKATSLYRQIEELRQSVLF